MSESRAGACRCGKVRFTVEGPPMITMACHCRGCQQMTASAFSLSALVPEAAFHVTEGEPTIGGLHGAHRHFFCPWCMSWLFTRVDGMPLVNVRSTLLDQPGDWAEPFAESYTSEKLAWASTPARHSFTEFPPLESYPELMAAFARERGIVTPTSTESNA